MKSVFLIASADKSSITASKSPSIDKTVIGNLVVSVSVYFLVIVWVPFEAASDVVTAVEVTKQIKQTKSLRNHAECSKVSKIQFRTTI